MRVFIAGVMQGTRPDDQIGDQSYRVRISQALQKHVPGVHITDPWALNPNSVNYDDNQARHTFVTMTQEAGRADLLIAYLPVPSMGTAMEMRVPMIAMVTSNSVKLKPETFLFI